MYLKLMIDGVSSFPFSATGIPPFPEPVISYKKEIIENSRKQFAVPKLDVEGNIQKWHDEGKPAPKTSVAATRSSSIQKEVPKSFESKTSTVPIIEREKPAVSAQIPKEVRSEIRKPAEVSAPKKEAVLPPITTEVGGDFLPLKDFAKKTVLTPSEEKKPETILPKKPESKTAPRTQSKTMTNENLSDLRSALAAVMKPKTPEVPKPEEKTAPKPKESEPTVKEKTEHKKEEAKPAPAHDLKEIPEQDLKNIFDL